MADVVMGLCWGQQVWGVPGWLKDPVRPLGDWGVASSAPLTLGRSLGEDWTELCGSELLAGLCFGCLVQCGGCWGPHSRANPGSAATAKGLELGKGRRGSHFPSQR